jgi:two-component system CheB/CheR fusion protein
MAKVQKVNSIKNDEFYMVGIGSSAGGIEALSLLVKHLPEDLNCCYVIAQHLSPNYKSILHEILNRESKLLVKKVADGEKPKKNTVYVIPPNKNLVVKNKTLILQEPPKEIFTKPSINILFESISQEYGENGIGIILSGTGTDGTQGLISIKAGGGITFAQIPKTAKYDGMPSSAIDSGSVDYEISNHTKLIS